MKKQKKNIYKAGSYIYIEGDEDINEVHIVEKGLIEFTSSNERVKIYSNSAGPGDVFGFITSLSNKPRMETAFAKVNSRIIIFTREKFLTILQNNSEIAVKLINAYADKLREYDNMIFPLDGKKDIFSPTELKLFNLCKYYYETNVYENVYYILLKYFHLYPDGSFQSEAREILNDIESTGIRQLAEPIKDEIYRLYADKQIIFCENEPGDELFIIKKGKVKIVKNHNDTEIMLSVLDEGDIFGELAIVSDNPRNATAISYGSSTLLPIDKDSLITLMHKSPDILKRIFTAISERVWFTFIRMESKIYEKPITKIYVFLENKLLEDGISLKSRVTHSFSFGIDELLKMINLSQDKIGNTINEILKDTNLSFNFGQITIENSSLVSSKSKFYRSRDHLYDGHETAPGDKSEKKPAVSITELSEIKDIDETEGATSELFDELDKEIP